MDAAELLSRLERQGVILSLAGDGDRVRLEGPEHVLTAELVQAVARVKPQLIILLQKRQTYAVRPGVVVRIYPMRESCRAAGHCLGLTRETDCSLSPVRRGWCRERVRRQGGEDQCDG